ncbi:MAG: DUF4295 family protein [Fidelibacterota bacterium]
MAKKQQSFADKAAGSKGKESIYVKYVKSVKSEKTGQWRFNEQMVRSKKGEGLDVALKRMDEVANLVDIDLSKFLIADTPEVPEEDAVVEANETVDEPIAAIAEEQPDNQDDDVENSDASNEDSIDEPVAEESPVPGTEESKDISVDSGSNDEAPSEDDSSEPEENKSEKEG